MKIQKTEMEIVAFGTQDVIATSGFDWTGKNMFAQGNILKQLAPGFLFPTADDDKYYGYLYTNKPTKKIFSAEISMTSDVIGNSTQYTSDNVYYKAGTPADILDWINAHKDSWGLQ